MSITPSGSIKASETVSKTDQKDRDLRKACSDFEAIFINSMMQAMRKTLPGDGLFAGGLQKDIYESMYDQQLAQEAASGKGLGIGEALYRQLEKSSR